MIPQVPTDTAEVRTAITSIRAEGRQLAEPLSEGQLKWQPGPDRWGVGQCLEHLTVTARQYANVMEPALAGAPYGKRDAEPGALEFSMMGKFFVRVLTAPGRKFPVPKTFAPHDAGAQTLPHFERTHTRLLELLERAEGMPLPRIKTHSPVSRLIRLNLADCFAILVIHANRHLAQARRVLDSPGFPPP